MLLCKELHLIIPICDEDMEGGYGEEGYGRVGIWGDWIIIGIF